MSTQKERSNTQDGNKLKMKVKERHASLNGMIENLSVLLSDVSSNIDKEFLAAYKAHVVEVQSELRSLKQQVTVAETQLNDDTTVASLEAEVKWLTDEVTRLRLNSQSMKKDMAHILDRINILNEQKEFLADQLKQVMKRNKVLESEIGHTSSILQQVQENQERGRTVNPDELSEQEELIVERTGEIDFDGDDMDYDGDGGEYGGDYNAADTSRKPLAFDDVNEENDLDIRPQGTRLPTLSSAKQGQSRSQKQNSFSSGKNMSSKGRLSRGQSRSRSRSRSRSPKRQEEEEPVDLLLRPMKKDSPSKDRARAAAYGPGLAISKLDDMFAARSPEEVIFEKEVERVFRQIVARKIEQAAKKTSRPNTQDPLAQEDYFLHQAKKMGGVSGLGLEHFSDTDRFATIINFLDNPEIFEKIVQILATDHADMPVK